MTFPEPSIGPHGLEPQDFLAVLLHRMRELGVIDPEAEVERRASSAASISFARTASCARADTPSLGAHAPRRCVESHSSGAPGGWRFERLVAVRAARDPGLELGAAAPAEPVGRRHSCADLCAVASRIASSVAPSSAAARG